MFSPELMETIFNDHHSDRLREANMAHLLNSGDSSRRFKIGATATISGLLLIGVLLIQMM